MEKKASILASQFVSPFSARSWGGRPPASPMNLIPRDADWSATNLTVLFILKNTCSVLECSIAVSLTVDYYSRNSRVSIREPYCAIQQ